MNPELQAMLDGDKTGALAKRIASIAVTGKPFIIAEYRGHKTGMMEWRDKTSGKTLTAPTLTHNLDTGSDQYSVRERLPDTFDIAKYVTPHRKGDQVVIMVDSVVTEKGVTRYGGKVEPLLSKAA